MSVSFYTDLPLPANEVPSCCLCAQDSPAWTGIELPEGEAARESLRAYAAPSCRFCGGSGIEYTVEDDSPTFANDNAAIILEVLGLTLVSEVAIDVFSRACIRALNTAEESLPSREARLRSGQARVVFCHQPAGEVAAIVRGPKTIEGGQSASELRSKIARLQAWAIGQSRLGARVVRWS